MSEAGKGSKPRPISVSQQEYDSRWDAIFAREVEQKKKVINELGEELEGELLLEQNSNLSR